MNIEEWRKSAQQLTVEEAKTLKYGEILLVLDAVNADGTPMRCKVNGRPKTWKTRIGDVSVPLKRGLYEYLRVGTTVRDLPLSRFTKTPFW